VDKVCLAAKRFILEKPIAEEFIRRCVEKTQKLRLGAGSDPGTDIGPLIRPQHVQRMSDLLADAVQHGAFIVCGGKQRPDLGPNFFEPTIVTGVNCSMQLFQDETFGPIAATFEVVKDAEEAIQLANGTEFSLAASMDR
jgi:acyl-CoA reductase-like NAD-dependent aldehyde dehydrogenase